MVWCLNPDCSNPDNPHWRNVCRSCGTPLVALQGHYRFVKLLSAQGDKDGGTYLARDEDKLNRLCIIKNLGPIEQPAASHQQTKELLDQETRIRQALGAHPQFASLYAYFEENGWLYLVEEFIEGQTLLTELQQLGNWGADQIREVLLDILPALHLLHDAGVIHRDITPARIVHRYTPLWEGEAHNFAAPKPSYLLPSQPGDNFSLFSPQSQARTPSGIPLASNDSLFLPLTQNGYQFFSSPAPVIPLAPDVGIAQSEVMADWSQASSGVKFALIDFGAPKLLVEQWYRGEDAASLGTEGYAPPEVWYKRTAFASSDLFALGVTCFQLLSGKDPVLLFRDARRKSDGVSGYDWLKSWWQHLPQPLDPQLTQVLGKLLQPELSDRYQSAIEVILDLQPPSQPQFLQVPEPVVESVPEPVVESVPEPVVESVPEPVVESVPEPVVESVLEPVVELVPESVVESVPESVVESVPEPVVESVPEPVAKVASEVESKGAEVQRRSGSTFSSAPLPPIRPPTPTYLPLQKYPAVKPHMSSKRSSKGGRMGLWALCLLLFGVVGFGVYKLRDMGLITKVLITDRQEETSIPKSSTGSVSESIGSSRSPGAIPSPLIPKPTPPPPPRPVTSPQNGTAATTLLEQSLTTFGEGKLGFAPIALGEKILISGDAEGKIQIWNLNSGRIAMTLAGHSRRVWTLAISPDGKTLVSGGDDSTLKIWDSRTGVWKKTLKAHENWVSSAVITPDGKYIISGGGDGTIRIWDLKTGSLQSSLKAHSDWVSSLSLSADGQTLASASFDKTIKVWNLSGARVLPQKTLLGHEDAVRMVAVSTDGKTLVSGSYDQTVKVWDLGTGTMTHNLTGHSQGVMSVVISPDGKTLFSGGEDKTVRIWSLPSGELKGTLEEHRDTVMSLAVSRNGQNLVSASLDGTIVLRRLTPLAIRPVPD